jgi:hypothetical protein
MVHRETTRKREPYTDDEIVGTAQWAPSSIRKLWLSRRGHDRCLVMNAIIAL